jgi:hypothetical protein
MSALPRPIDNSVNYLRFVMMTLAAAASGEAFCVFLRAANFDCEPDSVLGAKP